MKPLSAKELEYVVDSMSNEDLLIKQCISAGAQSQNPAVKQICQQLAQKHTQHYQTLMSILEQHVSIAPKTVQEADQMAQAQQIQAQQAQMQQPQGSQQQMQ